ncbi:hypothetical protein [Coxiella burnetii]|uniref:Uncharacterized protein n=2 Tax=Coxiella burnetii TaxID=777 RepID=Q83EZ6_COXBU|nr:hypothetical protein [Coxiella burnetii]NP_819207.1 hypothetical protein CBU_0157 [Coxiella burnetii RSA 493]AAO89721.1 hypothetical protein CBU_0157 [Coxiella burnetii RSA 493]ACI23219.1 hypothetical protein CBUD_1947a [Coxiella burnetii Dugway 5J108-111]ACJ19108.1 hypothetical protein CbuG_1856 [Coxiella burnetii CbuG_Q212]ACJ21005.1 hypothetical protein CbuK_1893 [Coxiella burnetii CbuK_Q154]AML47889.1 hypothetical protein AUR58_00895 [Coxiella burnetii]
MKENCIGDTKILNEFCGEKEGSIFFLSPIILAL